MFMCHNYMKCIPVARSCFNTYWEVSHILVLMAAVICLLNTVALIFAVQVPTYLY